MGAGSHKIINDPVYGFITIDHPLILELIRHPFYQRLRRIQHIPACIIPWAPIT